MAKTGGRSRRGQNADPSRGDADRIIDAALALVPTEGWQGLSLAAIADRAQLPILQVYRIFRSKQAILRGLYRRVDEIVLAEPPTAEPDERPRDRLFDLPDDEALIDELAAVRLREVGPGVYRMDHDRGRHDDQAIALALAAQHLVERRSRPYPQTPVRLYGSPGDPLSASAARLLYAPASMTASNLGRTPSAASRVLTVPYIQGLA